MVFARFPGHLGRQLIYDDDQPTVQSCIIYDLVLTILGNRDFSLYYNGKILPQGEPMPTDANVEVTLSLPGGKGGFGSMLRAIGAQIEKTTNREACRDLSGRRLRDINEEERLKKWLSKEAERKADKARRRKERIERLKAKPRHNFNDFEYEKKLSEWPDRVEEALAAGMEKKNKRPASEASSSAVQPKKKHLWLEDDISSSSDSDPEAGASPKATASSASAGSSNEEAGCSSQPQATFPDEGNSSDVTPTNDNSSSGEASKDDSAPDSIELSKATLTQPKESSLSVEDSRSSSNEENANMVSSDAAPSSNIEENVAKAHLTNDPSSSSNQEDVATKSSNQEKLAVENVVFPPIDLMSFNNQSELEALGLDHLKAALMERGLKCGGSLKDRAQRLWQVRGLEPHQYPPKLMAKKK